jgi:hypothetical protein
VAGAAGIGAAAKPVFTLWPGQPLAAPSAEAAAFTGMPRWALAPR